MARKKKKGDDIRTDGWMDTFADTMTLLLTFFILLYSISITPRTDMPKYFCQEPVYLQLFHLYSCNVLFIYAHKSE